MNSIDLTKEIEFIVKDLCKCANKQDKYALVVVNEIRKELEVLEQYKNIENEIGISLITLFKAYTDGFYVKGEEEKQYIDFENSLNAIAFKNKEMFYGHKWSFQYVKLYDYGKTWALTIEELEKC